MIKTSTRPERRRAKLFRIQGVIPSGFTFARSKYMPHIGNKERGRYAPEELATRSQHGGGR